MILCEDYTPKYTVCRKPPYSNVLFHWRPSGGLSGFFPCSLREFPMGLVENS